MSVGCLECIKSGTSAVWLSTPRSRSRSRSLRSRASAWGQTVSPSASYLEKSKVAPSPSNQGCLLLVGPFLRQGSFTPVLLRGPAPNGHPCPDGALAASMRLGPLRKTCAQPAPKSRLVSSGRLAYEDQDQDLKRINSFPAEAGPTVEVTANPTVSMRCLCRTGFSREAFDLLWLSAFGFRLLAFGF
ncbi:hypothetical protein SAMN05216197_10348 [Pseudomonas graminis]|uniref:Uncharacterized protein n=1 Tax=Pseudomonas graminis TaxID=158627 RepID=A0A1I0A024_9PSED|nr:hypothetical protein SAMN05216197_10348 [Pseudomonas graminis]